MLAAPLGASPDSGHELRCQVRSVSGLSVIIGCDGAAPRPGDGVKLGFEVPGAGFVPLEGAWKVSLIGPGGEIKADPEGAAQGIPRPGYVALIRTDATPAPSGLSPSGPSVIGPSAVAAGADPAGAATNLDRARLPPAARWPWLGVTLAPPDAAATPGIPVQAITPASPAERAGMLAGDRIAALAGVPAAEIERFLAQLRSYRAGDAVELRLRRGASEMTVRPVLGEPPLEDPGVQRAIGHQYLSGEGVPADVSTGIAWLERAAAGGYPAARADLEQIRQRITGNAPEADTRPPLDDFFGRPPAPAGTQPSTAAPPSSMAERQTSGLLLAGREKGNRSGYFVLESAVRQLVASSGARVRPWPADAPFPPGAAPEPKEFFQAPGAPAPGWLLYLDVELKWARLGFGRDKIKVSCVDPAGKERWKAEASNLFAESADQSLRILADKITRELQKRIGQACLLTGDGPR